MRLALTGGGTGGHIIPALAVMEAVQARLGGTAEVCFFGPEDRGERAHVEGAGVRFVGVPSAAVRGRGPVQLARAGWRLVRGTVSAVRAFRRFKPDAVFSTGGYGSFPAASPQGCSAGRWSSTCRTCTRAGRSKPSACWPRR